MGRVDAQMYTYLKAEPVVKKLNGDQPQPPRRDGVQSCIPRIDLHSRRVGGREPAALPIQSGCDPSDPLGVLLDKVFGGIDGRMSAVMNSISDP
jgi:hypothetical protein